MENNQNNQNNQIKLNLPDEVAEGTYSNLVVVSHSPMEFVVDFVSMLPGMAQPKVKSRIILTPQNAKRLFLTLGDNIKRYESSFGPIKDNGNEGNAAFPFGTPSAQA